MKSFTLRAVVTIAAALVFGAIVGVLLDRTVFTSEKDPYDPALSQLIGTWELEVANGKSSQCLQFQAHATFMSCDTQLVPRVRSTGMFQLKGDHVSILPTLFADCPEKCGGTAERHFRLETVGPRLIEENGRVYRKRLGAPPALEGM